MHQNQRRHLHSVRKGRIGANGMLVGNLPLAGVMGKRYSETVRENLPARQALPTGSTGFAA